MLVDCSGRLSLINTLINSPDDVPTTSAYHFSLFLEFLVIILGSLYTIYFSFLVQTVKIWHGNLNIIVMPFVLGTLFGNFGRLIIMKHEYVGYEDGLCSFSLQVGSFMLIFANCLVIHAIPTVLIERIFAYVYLKDYESKRRPSISFFTVTVLIIYTVALAVGLYTTVIPENIGTLYAGIIISTSSVGYLYLWMLNKRAYLRHTMLGTPRSYTLSVRYQLAENLRVFRLAKNMMIVVMAEGLVVVCIRLFTIHFLPNGILYLNPLMTMMQLFVITTCILNSDKWRNHLFSTLNFNVGWLNACLGRLNRGKMVHTPQEIYFIQLEMAWN